MLKCLKCGHVFSEYDLYTWEESRGEHFGIPCYEIMRGCPICEGDYEETVQCAVCGSEHLEDELFGGVCSECIDEYRKDFNACYEISIGETKEIKINALLASLFDVSDIEQILKEYIREKRKDVDCSQFIDEDIQWFGEKISEEVKNGENSKN